MGIKMGRSVHLVFGEYYSNRVSVKQVKNKPVEIGRAIGKHSERLMGVIGHYEGKLTPKKTQKILAMRRSKVGLIVEGLDARIKELRKEAMRESPIKPIEEYLQGAEQDRELLKLKIKLKSGVARAESYSEIGRILMKRGRKDEATAFLKEALRLFFSGETRYFKDKAPYFSEIAKVYQAMDRDDEFRIFSKKARAEEASRLGWSPDL